MAKLKKEIENLKSTLSSERKSKETLVSKMKDELWDKTEVVVYESSIANPLNSLHKDFGSLFEKLDSLIELFNGSIEACSKHSANSAEVASLKDQFKELEGAQAVHHRATEKILDELVTQVNEIDNETNRTLPAIFSQAGFLSNKGWISPALLSAKLKEDYKKLKKEYLSLRNQLTKESKPTVESNTELADQVKELTSRCEETRQLFEKERQEKESLIQNLQSKEKLVFDALKFKSATEDNEKLRKEVEELKLMLFNEKKLKINDFYDSQTLQNRLAMLSTEVNLLENQKVVLMNELQTAISSQTVETTSMRSRIDTLELESAALRKRIAKQQDIISKLMQTSEDSGIGSYLSSISRLQSSEDTSITSEVEGKQRFLVSEGSKRIVQEAERLKDHSLQTLGIVGKSDAHYKSEIEKLKQDLHRSITFMDKLSQELGVENNELAIDTSIRKLQEKISLLESTDEGRETWADPVNSEVTGSIDVNRVLKALKKSHEVIADLQRQIESKEKNIASKLV